MPSAGRLPMLRIKVRRDQLAVYGIKGLRRARRRLGPGRNDGRARCSKAEKRFRLQVRLPESWRNDAEKIELDPDRRHPGPADRSEATWPTSSLEEGPSEVERENVQRRAYVGVNVRGRDIAGFVADAQKAIEAEVKHPPGYSFRWGGQFEHLQTASRRLAIVVPVAMLMIFLLLYTTFHSLRLAVLDLPGRADGGDRRRLCTDSPRAAVLDLGRGGVHRPLRRGRLERPGLGQRRRAPAAGRATNPKPPRARPRSSGCGPS